MTAEGTEELKSPRAVWALIGVETLCFLGSEIARFGVSVWIYEATQSVSAFGMLLFANTVPGLLASPWAGQVVDRHPRKQVMIGASIIALCGTLTVLVSASLGHLSLIPIVLGAAFASVGEALQWPALAATVPLMTTEEVLPKYNGFLESGRAASTLAGPIVGGACFALLGLRGLLAIEVCTFLIATAVVSSLQLPAPGEGPGEQGGEEEESLAGALFGIRWILRHRPLFKFLCAAVFANFFLSIGTVLMSPYCLGLLSEKAYGIASGAFGAGMIVGGVVYGVLAERFKNIHLFIGSALLMGLLYSGYGFARTLPALAGIEFGIAVLMTLGNAAIMTIWQVKVPEALSGRVLSAMWMIAECTGPIAYLLAGPIGDDLMPWIFALPGAARIGALWGASKPGQLGALFSAIGVIVFLGFAAAASVREIREVEESEV